MLPQDSNCKVDFSQASEKPNSLDYNSDSEASETRPDDFLPKTQEDETNDQDRGKTVVDDQIMIANLHGG